MRKMLVSGLSAADAVGAGIASPAVADWKPTKSVEFIASGGPGSAPSRSSGSAFAPLWMA